MSKHRKLDQPTTTTYNYEYDDGPSQPNLSNIIPEKEPPKQKQQQATTAREVTRKVHTSVSPNPRSVYCTHMFRSRRMKQKKTELCAPLCVAVIHHTIQLGTAEPNTFICDERSSKDLAALGDATGTTTTPRGTGQFPFCSLCCIGWSSAVESCNDGIFFIPTPWHRAE